MHTLTRQNIRGRTVTIAHSTKADGDLSPSGVPGAELIARRARAVDHPWRAVHQVHSDRVITVDDVAPPSHRPYADAIVTDRANLAIAVHSGDCIPVGFAHAAGAVGVAHAGWKGLEAGVIESTVRALRSFDEPNHRHIVAVVGPHIRAEHYEFGSVELERLAKRFDPSVVAATASGSPALDLTAAVGRELTRCGVDVEAWSPDCTAAHGEAYWSHRARAEAGRIALVAWIENDT